MTTLIYRTLVQRLTLIVVPNIKSLKPTLDEGAIWKKDGNDIKYLSGG